MVFNFILCEQLHRGVNAKITQEVCMVARLVCIIEIQSVVVGAGGWWPWWLLSILQGHGSYQIFESSSLLSKAGFVAQNMDVTVL